MADRVYEVGEIVGVLTTEPLGRTLDYKAPEGGCGDGDFVEVPLGPRKVLGVVWGKGQGDWDPAKVRPINRVLDAAPMRAELRTFLTRAADYTLTPLPAMLRLATRAPGLGDAPSTRRVYRLTGVVPNTLTDARHRVVEALREYGGAAVTLAELAEAAGCGASVVKGLVKLGVVVEEDAPKDVPYPVLHPAGGARLAGDQVAAGDALVASVALGGYSCTLLKGVTGSGKTEVYLEAVAECLRRGQQALGAVAGNCADGGFPDAGAGAVWRAACRMAFRRDDDRTPPLVADGGARRCGVRGGGAVGAVPAISRPWPDRGR